MNKKLYYISGNRFPTEKANGIQIAHMCEAFAKQGSEVYLTVPNRKNHLYGIDPYSYYSVGNVFSINRIRCFDVIQYDEIFGILGNIITKLSFTFSVGYNFLLRSRKYAIYTREFNIGVLLRFLGYRKIYLEIHSVPSKYLRLYAFLLKFFRKIIVITHGIKDELKQVGVNERKILVAHDGVNINTITYSGSQQEARKKVGLDTYQNLVVYTGHYYPWKGVDTLFKAALGNDQYTFIFVGGTPNKIAEYKEKYKNNKNIIIVGKVLYSMIKYYLASADILVIPNSGEYKISQVYTSPLKLFEYMTSGKPIIASDLQSLKEILNEESALFFESDNANDLLEKINLVFNNYKKGLQISRKAKEIVHQYTRDKRAEEILYFINMKQYV